ncbi:hypothetical protein HRS9139_05822 [Pyrenophora teres f. teres]|nr:hypothetical protein HRS9139_05822 [Pyrenophora teres f. teres]
MATSGVNLAVTKDGETYNKLQRPFDYLTSTQSTPPPLAAVSSSAVTNSKRKRDQNDESGNKRLRNDRSVQNHKGRPRASQTYQEHGIQTVLPGLDGEEQLSDESTGEALAYLQSVSLPLATRSEASTIPTLLVALNKPNEADSDSYDDEHAARRDTADAESVLYSDGAYIAVDSRCDAEIECWDGDPHDLAPQESCHMMLLQRFRAHRNKLAEIQKDIAVPSQATVTGDSRRTQKTSKQEWSDIVERDYPVARNVVQLDDPALYLALQGCALALDRTAIISRQQSCWIWTLLALVGEFGTLDYKRIGKIRDLGLTAGRLATRLRSERLASQCSLKGDTGEQSVPGGIKSSGQEGYCRDKRIMGEATKVFQESASDVEDIGLLNTGTVKAGDAVCNVGSTLEDGDNLDGDANDSDADMIISDEEEEKEEMADGVEDGGLEMARARLLAQLGDRLVHSKMSSSDTQPELTPAQGPKQLSRVEAEIQRQEMRRQESHKEVVPHSLSSTTSPTRASQIGLDAAPLTGGEWNTKVTIDMILTVVAECYGQRDLLRFRDVW